MNALLITSEQRIVAQARKGLALVHSGETQTMEGWLIYGAALNEGREMFSSNEQFGQWVKGNLPETEQKEREAAMWAAGNLSEYRETRLANLRVRTVRGLHAKFKEAKAPQKAQPQFSDDDASHAKKLHALATRGSTEGERENAQVKLDAFAGNFGMSSDEVIEKSSEVQPEGFTKGSHEQSLANLTNALQKRPSSWLVELLLKAVVAADDPDLWKELMKGSGL